MELFGTLLMLVGSAFALLAAVGLHRFDSVFARMHAAGKSATFGLGLILLGVAVRVGEPAWLLKLSLVGLLGLVTIPAGVHLIARAAWRSGTEMDPRTEVDPYTRERIRIHELYPDD